MGLVYGVFLIKHDSKYKYNNEMIREIAPFMNCLPFIFSCVDMLFGMRSPRVISGKPSPKGDFKQRGGGGNGRMSEKKNITKITSLRDFRIMFYLDNHFSN